MTQDFRLAVRSLRATPIVTTAVILSLALGIGANTAVFSLLDSVALRSLPIVDPDRIIRLSGINAPEEGGPYSREFEVSPRDPIAFTGAAAALALVALVAASIPARRASRIDPAETLRQP